MERPSRNKKDINYNVDFKDDDDEDFAVKAPASKKARLEPDKKKKTTVKAESQENGHLIQDRKERTPLSDKLYERDLEAALTLSMLQTSETREDEGQQVDENQAQHSAPPLSNCSVDSNNHGLNDITDEQLSPKSSKQRKAASLAQASLKEDKDCAADEDYLPQNTPDSGSEDEEDESDFSEEEESEDEEFTIKKGLKKNKQSKGNKKAPPPKKEKQTPKATKSKAPATTTVTPSSNRGLAIPTISLSPVTTKTASALKKPPATPPMSSPVLSTSPAGGRIPKWNPPGQVGRSPGNSQGVALKSPGQGLRLGLSRMARVKPLHPNTAAH